MFFLTRRICLLPAAASTSSTEAAASEMTSSEAATAAAPASTSEAATGITTSSTTTDEDVGAVVAPQPDDDDDENDEGKEVTAALVIVDDHRCGWWQFASLQLSIYSLTRLKYGEVGVACPHIGFDEVGGDAVARDVGQKLLQSHSRRDEVLPVFHGDDDDQSGAGVLVAHAVFVAYVLRHSESVAVTHMVDDDEHRLHVEFAVEFAEIVVGTVAVLLREDIVGVADKLCGVGQENHRDIVGVPNGVSVFCLFNRGGRQ